MGREPGPIDPVGRERGGGVGDRSFESFVALYLVTPCARQKGCHVRCVFLFRVPVFFSPSLVVLGGVS